MPPGPDGGPSGLTGVTVEDSDVELASAAIWAAGAHGIEERRLPDGQVQLITAMAAEQARRGMAAAPHLDGRWRVDELSEPDGWEDRWLEWVPTTRVGRLQVRPPWLKPPDGEMRGADEMHGTERVDVVIDPTAGTDVVDIVIDPTGAFGSGAHPSTRLVLQELALQPPTGSVLDVGSGSGILSVSAAALGASTVISVDIDAHATAATARNAERNGVAHLVHAVHGGIQAVSGPFDLVVANVLLPAHLALADDYLRLVGVGRTGAGNLVLSGLLDSQADVVVERLGATEVRRRHLDGWVVLTIGADHLPARHYRRHGTEDH